MRWYCGLKLHLINNDRGDVIDHHLIGANVGVGDRCIRYVFIKSFAEKCLLTYTSSKKNFMTWVSHI